MIREKVITVLGFFVFSLSLLTWNLNQDYFANKEEVPTTKFSPPVVNSSSGVSGSSSALLRSPNSYNVLPYTTVGMDIYPYLAEQQ